MTRTIQEWRELRSMSIEGLAECIGVPESMVERWEKIGLGAEPGSLTGDYFMSRLVEALDAGEGLKISYVPDSPNPGDLIITPGRTPGFEIEDLLDRAEALNLRVAVPDPYGMSLKPPKNLTDEDNAALIKHFKRERAYSESVVRRMTSTLELLGDGWEEGQALGQRLEQADKELSQDLDNRGGAA